MIDTNKLREWIASRCGRHVAEITDEAPLFTSGWLDSFDLTEFVAFFEESTGIRVRALDFDARYFDSIREIRAFAIRNGPRA